MTDLAQVMMRWRRQACVQRMLDACGPWYGWSIAAAAGAVFIVRLAIPDGGWLVLPVVSAALVVPLVTALVIAAPGAWRRPLPDWRIAGDIDRRSGAEGVVMALAAGAPTDWMEGVRTKLATVRLPAWSWQAWRSVPATALCLLIALMIPQLQPKPPRPADGAAFIAPLAAQIQMLRDQGLAPEAELARLDEALAKVANDARQDGLDPLRWEALDRVQRAATDLGAQAERRLADALAAAAAGASMEATASEAAATMVAGDLAAAIAALAKDAPGLAKLDAATMQALAEAAMSAAKAGQLDPELAKKLCAMAKSTCSGGRCSGANLARLASALEKDLAAKRACLASLGLCQKPGLCLSSCAGNGGVDRGPGHAELNRVEREAVPIGESQGLPPGATIDPDGSITFATTIREPDKEQLAAAARAAARTFDPASADARRVQIAPRHRAAVAAYFTAAALPADAAPTLSPSPTQPPTTQKPQPAIAPTQDVP